MSAAANAAGARLAGGSADFANPEKSVFSYQEIRRESQALRINPTCKELYLADDEFEELFGMPKAAFYALRQWQQREMKQRLRLF